MDPSTLRQARTFAKYATTVYGASFIEWLEKRCGDFSQRVPVSCTPLALQLVETAALFGCCDQGVPARHALVTALLKVDWKHDPLDCQCRLVHSDVGRLCSSKWYTRSQLLLLLRDYNAYKASEPNAENFKRFTAYAD